MKEQIKELLNMAYSKGMPVKGVYTVQDIAQFVGKSRNAIYQQYRRGNISRLDKKAHILYFTPEEMILFVSEFYPYILY